MTSIHLKSADTPWLALDGNLTVFEGVAVLAVLVWGGALVWMATNDVLRFRAHHGHHRPDPGRDPRDDTAPREHPR